MELDLDARTDRLAQLLEERLDVRGTGYSAKLKRAGRLLPRHIRKEASLLADALALSSHPRMARQVDMARLKRAADTIERYLLNLDPWDRRKAIAVNFSAGLAFNLLIVAVLVIGFLLWRGLI